MWKEFISEYKPVNGNEGDEATAEKIFINIAEIISIREDRTEVYCPQSLRWKMDNVIEVLIGRNTKLSIYETSYEELKNLVMRTPKNVPFATKEYV